MYIRGYFSIALILALTFVNVEGRNDERRSLRSIFTHPSSNEYSTTNAQVAADIRRLINEYPVMVFAKSTCRFSIKAKSILSNYNLGKNYFALDIDKLLPESKADQYYDELAKLTYVKTVPQVFIDGQFVGGGDDIEAMQRSGKLNTALRRANAIVF